MDHIFAYVIFFLIICAGIYGVFLWISNKINPPLLWHPTSENVLKESLIKINSSLTLEGLKSVFLECIKQVPKYYNVLELAMEEKQQDISFNKNYIPFEVKKAKIRKMWLVTFIAFYLLIWYVINLLINSLNENLATTIITTVACSAVILSIMFIIYYCAYKKQGTGLLSWIVIAMPFRVLLSFINEKVDFSSDPISVIYLFLFGFFWLSSLYLWKINKKEKTKKQLDGLKAIIN